MFDKLKDLGGLMAQAQQMQQKMKDLQAELERLEIVGSSGAGLVKVTAEHPDQDGRDGDDADRSFGTVLESAGFAWTSSAR